MFVFDTILTKLNEAHIPNGHVRAVQLKNSIKNLFKDVKFTIKRVESLTNGDYTIGGFFLEETNTIQIILLISSKSKGYVNINNSQTFKFHLAQTIQHEYVHLMQYIKREEFPTQSYSLCKNGSDEQKYLGERDEIDAYSYDIAIEIVNYGWQNSQTLNIYRKNFPNKTDRIMKRLLKKVYKNLQVIGA